MNTKKLFIILLTFVISFCFCGCANNKNYANDNLSIIEASQEKFRFLVTVLDNNGDTVEGVVLRLSNYSNMIACTNKDGVATFPLIASSGYKLSVVHCPKGYEYTGDANVHIKQGTSEYILNITKNR